MSVKLFDAAGAEHVVTLYEPDWQRAAALTPFWRIADCYGKLQVVSTALPALAVAFKTGRAPYLLLARYIREAGRDETVHHHDANTLHLVGSNLYVVAKGTRIRPTVPVAPKPPTRKQLELQAKIDAIFNKPKPDIVEPPVGEPASAAAPKRKRTRRPGAKQRAA